MKSTLFTLLQLQLPPKRFLKKLAWCFGSIIALQLLVFFLCRASSTLQYNWRPDRIPVITDSNYEGIKTELIARIAGPFANYLNACMVPVLFMVSLGLVLLLPFYLITKNYKNSKTIYTILRIPESRLLVYLSHLIPGFLGSLVLWLGGFFYLFILYGLYRMVHPLYEIPVSFMETLENHPVFHYFYTSSSPATLLITFGMLLLLSTLSISIAYWFHSKEKRALGIVSMIVVIITLFVVIFVPMLAIPVIWLADLFMIIIGLYYLNSITLC